MHPNDLKSEIYKMGKLFKAFENYEAVVDAVVALNEQRSGLDKEIAQKKKELELTTKNLKKEQDRLEEEAGKTIAVEENAKLVAAKLIEDAQTIATKVLADSDKKVSEASEEIVLLKEIKAKLVAEVSEKDAELKAATDKFEKLKSKISSIVEA